MLKDSDSQSNLSQDNNPSPSKAHEPSHETPVAPPQKPIPALKLVVSNIISDPISAPIQKSGPIQRKGFIADVRKRSPYNFVLAARDHFHYLSCDLLLTLEENEEGQAACLIAEFPTIYDEALAVFIDDDEDLLGMILIQFHMHILKSLLLFCFSRKIRTLMIRTNEHQAGGLGIYEDFIKHANNVPVKNGIAMCLTIPVNAKVLGQCNNLMDDIVGRFRRMLWEEKTSNSAMWNYLISNRHFSIVGLSKESS